MRHTPLAKLSRTNPLSRTPGLELTARQLWAISVGASVWLIDLEPYEKCRVVGVVKRLRVDPHERNIEVTIDDGTGQVVARWSIQRKSLALALVPGTAVALDGIAAVGHDGRLTLLEPGVQTIPYLIDE